MAPNWTSTVKKFGHSIEMLITSSIANRFSKFLHQWIHREICNKVMYKDLCILLNTLNTKSIKKLVLEITSFYCIITSFYCNIWSKMTLFLKLIFWDFLHLKYSRECTILYTSPYCKLTSECSWRSYEHFNRVAKFLHCWCSVRSHIGYNAWITVKFGSLKEEWLYTNL